MLSTEHTTHAVTPCSCNTGYRQTGDGRVGECSNIDECDALNLTHNCYENVTFGDTIRSFECQCNAVYTGDGAEGA